MAPHENSRQRRKRLCEKPFRVRRQSPKDGQPPPTPIETKRGKAPIGALGRIKHLNVAEDQDQAAPWLWTNNDRPNMGIGGITPAMKLKMAA